MRPVRPMIFPSADALYPDGTLLAMHPILTSSKPEHPRPPTDLPRLLFVGSSQHDRPLWESSAGTNQGVWWRGKTHPGVRAAAGRVAERAHQAVDTVASTAQRIGAHGEEWMAREDEVMGQVPEYVRERPFVSLAMATAVSRQLPGA